MRVETCWYNMTCYANQAREKSETEEVSRRYRYNIQGWTKADMLCTGMDTGREVWGSSQDGEKPSNDRHREDERVVHIAIRMRPTDVKTIAVTMSLKKSPRLHSDMRL